MYSWLRDGLIPGVSALLISLWLYAWFSFFLATGDGTATMRYPFAWLLELVLVPALAGRFLDRTRWGPASSCWRWAYGWRWARSARKRRRAGSWVASPPSWGCWACCCSRASRHSSLTGRGW